MNISESLKYRILSPRMILGKCKGKAIPVTDREGP
jgi:hypothetical protein